MKVVNQRTMRPDIYVVLIFGPLCLQQQPKQQACHELFWLGISRRNIFLNIHLLLLLSVCLCKTRNYQNSVSSFIQKVYNSTRIVTESQFCDGASVEIIQFLAAFLRPFAFDTAGSNQKNVYAYPLDTLWLRQIVGKKISFLLRHHKF